VAPTAAARLSGSPSPAVGRLEIYRKQAWGAVYTYQSANVSNLARTACRQLGYDAAAIEQESNMFADPTVNIQWVGISCSGAEASVDGCSFALEGWTYQGSELGLACYTQSAVGM
jgi:hypothetical protein